MTKKPRPSVFLRYALSYTAVVLLLFFSITGYLYARLSAQVREDLIDTQINRLSRIASQHESAIAAMLSSAEEIGLSPYIEPFRYAEEPWKAYDLQRQMVPYTTANTFCDQVFLHFFGDDRIYSSSSSMTLSLFARVMRYESIPMEHLSSLISGTDRFTILPSQRISSTLVDSSRVVTFLIPLGSETASSDGLLLFLAKDSAYQALFSDAINSHVSTCIYQDGILLSASENPPGFPEPDEFPAGQASRTFRRNGEDWTQVTLFGRSWGLTYTAVLRNADLQTVIFSRIFSTLAILPLFVILCLILALWMAQRHARPIRAITGLLDPDGESDHRDELQQISSGIRQLATENRELSSRLEQALPVQRHDFILEFIRGHFSSHGEAIAAGRAVRLNIDRPFYAVILCSGTDETGRPLPLDRPPFDGFSGFSGAGVELVALKATLYLVFADVPEMLLKLADRIRTESNSGSESDSAGCVTSISAFHRDPEDAPTAYLEAAAAYENRFVMGSGTVLCYNDISSNLETVLPQALKLTESISQALTLGSREVLDVRLNDLLHFLKNTSMSPFAFRMIYSDVIHSLAHSHAAALAGGSSALDTYSILSLSSCQSIDDLDALLRRLCDRLLNEAASVSEAAPGEEDEITQVMRYMEAHYSDPEMSVTALADSVEVPAARFSVAFKEKTGTTPLEYLTLLRMEKAKELLASTDLTIREISLRVGYYDSGSFIRRFRQVSGETPLQYRRSRRANGAAGTEEAADIPPQVKEN